MSPASFSVSKSFTRLRRVGEIRCFNLPCSSAAAFSSVINNAGSNASHHQASRELGWSKWLLFLPGVMTFGLGTWQIIRRQEKIDMLEYITMRLSQDPILVNDASPNSRSVGASEFRKVTLKGIFDENKSIFVGPRSRSISGVTENGYYIITPLMPVPGNPDSVNSPILVNRGWVPRSWKDKAPQLDQKLEEPTTQTQGKSNQAGWWRFWIKNTNLVEGEGGSSEVYVDVVGVIRSSEKPSIFVPDNDPRSGQWFYVNVPAIASSLGLSEETLYVERIDESTNPSNPYPLTKELSSYIQRSVMPRDHLNYTLTWYSLSAAVTFMAFKRIQPTKFRR